MEPYICNIDEIIGGGGLSYEGEIAVFTSDGEETWRRLYRGGPIYVNAYTYALVLAGNCLLTIDDTEYALDNHTLSLILPQHLSRFHGRSADFHCLFLCLGKRFIDGMVTSDIQRQIVKGMDVLRHPVFHLTDVERAVIAGCMKDIGRQIARTTHLYRLEMIRNALARFYWEKDNILDYKKEAAQSVVQNRYATVLQDFTTLLTAHYKAEHTVGFYAQRLCITPQYLTAIVKQQTHRTVNTFIYEMLYCEARKLLRTSTYSIQQITAELHFSDPAAFCKFFKRKAGMTPKEFRISYL